MRTRARVLVVYKKDAYQQYVQEQQDPHLVRLLRRRQPDVVDLQRAHTVHEESLEGIVHALRQQPVDFDLAYRADLKVTKRYDLVVSVGGDGTFLQAARSVHRTPILGVNADPTRSEAVFCAATRRTFPRLLRRALAGKLPALRLYRLQVALNGKRMRPLALNDVLLAHDDPATMTRYRLRIGSREEAQKSSGLWIATAAGSSSAVLAAGGRQLAWDAKRFQYRPRELYEGRLSRCRLQGGVLPARSRIRVTWLMRRGSACLDGPHIKIPLRFADRLEVSLSLADPLQVLGLRRKR
jgi:NAD+ kinase